MAAVYLSGGSPTARLGHRVALQAREHGVIVRNLGDAVVFMPPLAMTPAEIKTCVAAVGAALVDVVGPA